jgi:hypothetical protein
MRSLTYLTMAMVPAALVAQSPAVPDYMAVLKTQTPPIDALLKDFQSVEALDKAVALLPPSLPAFDRSSPAVGLKTSVSFSGLTRLYLLAAKAAVQAGEWEKVLDLCTKAEACAKVNYENTKDVVTPIIATWTTAIEQANKYVADNGDRVKALQAKPGRSAAEETEYQAFLAKDKIYNSTKDQKEKNEAATWLKNALPHFKELEAKALTGQEQQELASYKVSENNLTLGPKTIKTLQENIDATKAEWESCPPKIESTQKNLKAEADELAKGLEGFKVKGKLVKETSGPKFEEKKAKYFESILNTKSNHDSRPAKLDRMNFLFRLRHNVAGTPLETKVNETLVRVRADQDPFPAPEKKTGKTKGKAKK